MVTDSGIPFGTKHKKEAAAELVSGSASVIGKMKEESMAELKLEGIKSPMKNKNEELRIPMNEVN